jgi:hypothetical protein
MSNKLMTGVESISTPSQHERFFTSHDVVAAGNATMLDLLFGTNPISDDELRRLVEKRPHVYGKFAGYLGKRSGKGETNA